MSNKILFGILVMSISMSSASFYAVGRVWESWDDVILTESKKLNSKEIGEGAWKFGISDITGWYFEEPGILFGAISAVVETEGNEAVAREKAKKDGRSYYTYEYGKPAPIPNGRWFRWQYASGSQIVEKSTPNWKEGEPPNINTYRIRFSQLQMLMIYAPIPIMGESGIYMMPSGQVGGKSVTFGRVDGDGEGLPDYSTWQSPINMHLGYQPTFFPWLTLEATAGWDVIQWGMAWLVGRNNYRQGYNYGYKVALGVDWLSIYYNNLFEVLPLYDGGGGSGEATWRSYEGTMSTYGIRLDIGNLFIRLFAD